MSGSNMIYLLAHKKKKVINRVFLSQMYSVNLADMGAEAGQLSLSSVGVFGAMPGALCSSTWWPHTSRSFHQSDVD